MENQQQQNRPDPEEDQDQDLEEEEEDPEEWMSTGRGSPSPSVTSDSCSASAAAAVSSPRSSALIPKTSSSSDLSNTITATTTTATTTLRSTDSCSSPSTMTTLLLDSLEQFEEDAKDHVGDDDTADEDDDDEYVDAEEGLLVANNENSNNPTIAAGPLVDPATFLLEAVFRQILLLNRQSLTFLMGLRAVSRTWATLVFAALNSQLNLTLFAPGGSDSLKSYVRSLVAVNLLGDPFYRLSEVECEELLGRRPSKHRSRTDNVLRCRRYRSVSSGGAFVNGCGSPLINNFFDPGPSTSSSFTCTAAASSSFSPTSTTTTTNSQQPPLSPTHLPTVLGNLQKLIVSKGNAENLDLGQLLTTGGERQWSASLQSLVIFRPPDGLGWCRAVAGLRSLTRLELYDLHRCSVDVEVLEPVLGRLEHLVLSWRHPHLLETAFLRAVLGSLVPGRLKHLGLLTNLAVREDGAQQEEAFEPYFPAMEYPAGLPRQLPVPVQGPRPMTRFEALFEQWPHGRALAAGLTGLHLGDVHLELLGKVVAAMPALEHLNFVADWKQNLHNIFETLRQLPRLSSLSLYYANYFMADARPVPIDPEGNLIVPIVGAGNLVQGPLPPPPPPAPALGHHGHHHHHHHHHHQHLLQNHHQNNHHHHLHHLLHHLPPQANPNDPIVNHPHPHQHHQQQQQPPHHGSTISVYTGKSAIPVLAALKNLTFRCQNLLDMGDGLPALLTAVAPACANFHLLDNSWNEVLPAAGRFAGLFAAARKTQMAQYAASLEKSPSQGAPEAQRRSATVPSTPAAPTPLTRPPTIHWSEDFRAFYPRRLWSRLPERCQEQLCLQYTCSQAVHNRKSRVCKARECVACRVAAQNGGGAAAAAAAAGGAAAAVGGGNGPHRGGQHFPQQQQHRHHGLLLATVHRRQQQQQQQQLQHPNPQDLPNVGVGGDVQQQQQQPQN